MKKLLTSKVVFAVLFLVLGAFTAAIVIFFSNYDVSISSKSKLADKKENSKSEFKFDSTLKKFKKNFQARDKLFDDYFDDDFFDNNLNPFEEMKKMRKRMQDSMDNFNKSFGHSFDGWFSGRFGGGNVQDFKSREDDKFVYYDITLDGLVGSNANVKIEKDTVTVSGEIEKTQEKDDQGFKAKEEYRSSFHRSFPVPSGVDADNAQIKVDKNKIIIQFPKLKKE